MFELKFETTNAAFTDPHGADDMGALQHETARILQQVAKRIVNGETAGKVRDENGNTVGSYKLTPDF